MCGTPQVKLPKKVHYNIGYNIRFATTANERAEFESKKLLLDNGS